jgi:DNA repair protein SbcD/Mre11
VRFLHTSDWHLGRSFHQVGLLDAQAQFVDHLVDTVRAEAVDAVLVSGDVYDRAMPAPDTVRLLSDAVTRLIDAGATVVLSSGNHDSAIRLGFASELLSRAGLHIRSTTEVIGRPILVGGAAIYAIPYLEPSVAATPLGAEQRTHSGVLRAAMGRVEADRASRGAPAIVMAHAFVTGGATSESERDISVGGVSAVHPRVFDGIDYVALGHLHRRQRLDETVRYSGSPVALSFSEAGHTKGSWLVDLDDEGVRAEPVDAPVGRPLAVLRGTLDDLLTNPVYAADERAWCQVTLTDSVRPLGAMERLRRRFPHALVLQFDPQGAPVEVRSYAQRASAPTQLEVCCDFLTHVRSGRRATDTEQALLSEALEAVRTSHGEREDEGQADVGSQAGAA